MLLNAFPFAASFGVIAIQQGVTYLILWHDGKWQTIPLASWIAEDACAYRGGVAITSPDGTVAICNSNGSSSERKVDVGSDWINCIGEEISGALSLGGEGTMYSVDTGTKLEIDAAISRKRRRVFGIGAWEEDTVCVGELGLAVRVGKGGVQRPLSVPDDKWLHRVFKLPNQAVFATGRLAPQLFRITPDERFEAVVIPEQVGRGALAIASGDTNIFVGRSSVLRIDAGGAEVIVSIASGDDPVAGMVPLTDGTVFVATVQGRAAICSNARPIQKLPRIELMNS